MRVMAALLLVLLLAGAAAGRRSPGAEYRRADPGVSEGQPPAYRWRRATPGPRRCCANRSTPPRPASGRPARPTTGCSTRGPKRSPGGPPLPAARSGLGVLQLVAGAQPREPVAGQGRGGAGAGGCRRAARLRHAAALAHRGSDEPRTWHTACRPRPGARLGSARGAHRRWIAACCSRPSGGRRRQRTATHHGGPIDAASVRPLPAVRAVQGA